MESWKDHQSHPYKTNKSWVTYDITTFFNTQGNQLTGESTNTKYKKGIFQGELI